MLRLFRASPAVGLVIGIALLVVGLVTGGYLLAAAGGFVTVTSAMQLLSGRSSQ